MVEGFVQKLPAGHGDAAVEPATQYCPVTQAVAVAGVVQKLSVGHVEELVDPAAQ